MNRRGIGIALGVAGVLLAGCSQATGEPGSDKEPSSSPTKQPDPVLQQAAGECQPVIQDALAAGDMADEVMPGDFVQLGDDGHSLTIANAPNGGSLSGNVTVIAMQCFLEETEAPDAVVSQVEQTNALMGRQEASWGRMTVSWSYHPDSGVSAVFTDKR